MQTTDPQFHFWNRAFSGLEYYYGAEPGSVARRAVRYHRPVMPRGGTALDAGCGEGQDLLFLAKRGYQATGLEFTPTGVEKARRLLEERGLAAEVLQFDLRRLADDARLESRQFDLVLGVNSIQFLGPDASDCLDALRERVRPGGVIGLSVFAREEGQEGVERGIWLISLQELMGRFPGWQMHETALLWQWGPPGSAPQAFATLIARRPL